MGSSNENSYFGPVSNPGTSSERTGRVRAARRRRSRRGWCRGHRHRHGRLDPPAGGAVGHLRHQADLRHVLALRIDRLRVEPRYPGCLCPDRAEDCALLLNAMAGHEPRDSTSLGRDPTEDYARDARAAVDRACASASPGNTLAPAPTPTSSRRSSRHSAEFRKLGAITVDISLPNVDLSVPVYYVIAPAEASSNLSRFDGVRYGHRAAKYADLIDMYKKFAPRASAPRSNAASSSAPTCCRTVLRRLLPEGAAGARLIADDFQRAYRECDVIIGPTSPSTAFQLGDKTGDPVQMYLSDIFTIAGNLTGAPQHVDSVRLRRQRAARRAADPGQLLPRGRGAQRCASVPAGHGLARARRPRTSRHERAMDMGSRHRSGDAHAAIDGLEDFLAARRRLSARRPIHTRRPWISRCRACCRY